MARLAVVFVSVLIQAAWGSAVDSHNVGVYGGKEISIEEAPYMALLDQANGGPCGGVIIHEEFILTTATCCNGTGTARWGSNGTIETGIEQNIKNYIKYPNNGLKTNICLVQLEKALPKLPLCSIVNKIQLTDGSPILAEGTPVTFTAFGWESPDEPKNPNSRTLRQATLAINGSNWCKQDTLRLKGSILCAGDNKKNACYADAGGALTYEGVLVGILSNAPSGCNSYAARFSSINYYRAWINQTIIENI